MTRFFDHAGDRMQFLHAAAWMVGALTVIACALAYFLVNQERIGLAGALVVLALGPLAGVALTALVWRGTGAASRGLVDTISAARGIRRNYEYSRQDSLVARGRLEEAVESYLGYLVEHPDDLDARLNLADLRRTRLHDAPGAERDYLDVRKRSPGADQEFRLGNALIDLYHATGQLGRELAELSRFADRFRDTEPGRRAREALRRHKDRPA